MINNWHIEIRSVNTQEFLYNSKNFRNLLGDIFDPMT